MLALFEPLDDAFYILSGRSRQALRFDALLAQVAVQRGVRLLKNDRLFELGIETARLGKSLGVLHAIAGLIVRTKMGMTITTHAFTGRIVAGTPRSIRQKRFQACAHFVKTSSAPPTVVGLVWLPSALPDLYVLAPHMCLPLSA